jgi:hypothetical protein
MTIEEAKEILFENVGEGIHCPLCTQFCKQYERKLNIGITVFLIGLYLIDPNGIEFHHAKDVLQKIGGFTTSRDYSILEYWNLVERGTDFRENLRTSGMWRITGRGIQFVKGRIKVQSHAVIYDATLLGYSGEMIDVYQALGNKFSYEELMRGSK